MIALRPELISTYNQVGSDSYCQHYLHLWENRNPLPYIESSFTEEVVAGEIQDDNLVHFIIEEKGEMAGIIKLVRNAPVESFTGQEAILLEKIYLLSTFTGQGLGKKCLQYVIDFATRQGKKVLWLDTMKKGRALQFYLDAGFIIWSEKDHHFKEILADQRPMYVLGYPLEKNFSAAH